MITIADNIVTVTKNGGGRLRAISLSSFLGKAFLPKVNTGSLCLPDGVKAVVGVGNGAVVVHQTKPRVHSFSWWDKSKDRLTAEGYLVKWGHKTVRLSLPYVITFSYMAGQYMYRDCSTVQCFFSKKPITSLDDELFYPALLNCMPNGSYLKTWVCCTNIFAEMQKAVGLMSEQQRLILRCLFEDSFNNDGFGSWFKKSSCEIPAISTVEKWEAASKKDPNFGLKVNWLPADHLTVGHVIYSGAYGKDAKPSQQELESRFFKIR